MLWIKRVTYVWNNCRWQLRLNLSLSRCCRCRVFNKYEIFHEQGLLIIADVNVSIESIAANTFHELEIRLLSIRSVTIFNGHNAYVQLVPRNGPQHWHLHTFHVQAEIVDVGHIDRQQQCLKREAWYNDWPALPSCHHRQHAIQQQQSPSTTVVTTERQLQHKTGFVHKKMNKMPRKVWKKK